MKGRPEADALDLQFPPPLSNARIEFPPGYPIRIQSSSAEWSLFLKDYYEAFQAEGSIPPETTYSIAPAWPRFRGFSLLSNGARLCVRRQIQRALGILDERIMDEVCKTSNPYFLIHAAMVTCGGRGVLLGGSLRSGKSTLTLGLILRGWQYLSDNITAICPDPLMAVPFPRNFIVRTETREVLAVDLQENGDASWVRPLKPLSAYVSPNRIWEGSLGRPAKVTHIVFLQYHPEASSAVVPMSRADAVSRLARRAWGTDVFGRQAVDILADLVEGAECVELAAGPLDEICGVSRKLNRAEERT
jgi:hypothetical protein